MINLQKQTRKAGTENPVQGWQATRERTRPDPFTMQHVAIRMSLLACSFMVFASACITTGILSYFIDSFGSHNAHIVYNEVMATLQLPCSIVSLALPFWERYRGQLMLFNLIMSYLWVPAFAFSAQDWTGGRCALWPPTTGLCNMKATVAAFNLLAFTFLFFVFLVEYLLWRATGRNHPERLGQEQRHHGRGNKEQRGATAGHGSSTPATNGASGDNSV
ncbi:glucose-6-phosphate 1-dehydrogenase [Purpureocillium lavendulum]|uniref:Glucose-6-phosphate 1-dehydrogenase n=1 Tax=Purpureocillium lavendulum TaxID=1247861 RepID=A0AB34G2K6_9HYPO|nr:glucose-6-phosphate 1-dehydrogenase [Purpureocillium lavendulum]